MGALYGKPGTDLFTTNRGFGSEFACMSFGGAGDEAQSPVTRATTLIGDRQTTRLNGGCGGLIGTTSSSVKVPSSSVKVPSSSVKVPSSSMSTSGTSASAASASNSSVSSSSVSSSSVSGPDHRISTGPAIDFASRLSRRSRAAVPDRPVARATIDCPEPDQISPAQKRIARSEGVSTNVRKVDVGKSEHDRGRQLFSTTGPQAHRSCSRHWQSQWRSRASVASCPRLSWPSSARPA